MLHQRSRQHPVTPLAAATGDMVLLLAFCIPVMAEDAPPAGDKTVTLTGKLTKEEKADANGKNVATYIVTDDAGVAKELPALMALDVKLAAAVGTMVTVTCKADELGNPVKVMTVAPIEQAGAGAAKHEKVAKAKHSGKAKKKKNNM